MGSNDSDLKSSDGVSGYEEDDHCDSNSSVSQLLDCDGSHGKENDRRGIVYFVPGI